MARIILVTGGQKSGKSKFAMDIAESIDGKKAFVATSIPFDEEMKRRIQNHREDRPKSWHTYENVSDYTSLSENEEQVYLFDCITSYLSTKMHYSEIDFERDSFKTIDNFEKKVLEEFTTMVKGFIRRNKSLVVVTGELGMGVIPLGRYSRIFLDIHGLLNQRMSTFSQEVYFMVGGIPMTIKGKNI